MAQTVQDDRCPKCLKPRFRGEQYCVNCGHLWPIPVERVYPQAPSVPEYVIPNVCLSCGSETIQKVKAYVAANKQTVSMRGTTSGAAIGASGPMVLGGITNSSGESSSILAELLAPPAAQSLNKHESRRTVKSNVALSQLGCFGTIAGGIGFMLVPDPMMKWASGAGAVLFFCVGLASVKTGPLTAEQVYANDVDDLSVRYSNESRMMAWDRSYYCQKCHAVFDPATNRIAQAENAQSLWS